MRRLWVAAIILATVSTACGGGSPTTSSPSPSPSSSVSRPSSTAKLGIVSPAAGETVPTSGVTVKLSLSGATIVQQTSTNLVPDKGHVHLLVDGQTISLSGGLEVGTGPLKAGPHLIQVEFVAVDHGPFNPRVIEQVTVTAA